MRPLVVVFVTTAALILADTSGNITWKQLPSMPVGVAGGASGLLNGTLIYAGGTTWADGVKQWVQDVREYDFAKRAWASGPLLPEPLAYGGFVQSESSFEILGGLNQNGSSRNCWRLDRDAKQWTRSGTLPQDSGLARVERVGVNTYLIGGCPDAADLSHCSTSVCRRDNHGQWTRVTEMPDGPIALRASAVLAKRIYLFGGCIATSSTSIQNRNEAWRYDPANNQWQKLRPMPEPIRGTAAAAVDGHRILLAGGYTTSQFNDSVWIYDSERDRYESTTRLPFPVSGIALVVRGQTILGLGGEDRMRSRTARFIEGTISPAPSNTLDGR